MHGKRVQAALEFLMTYGWAILIILTLIGTLSYFGVLNSDMFLPEKCSLPSGIACLDYRVESTRVIIIIKNILGETMTISDITVSSKEQECSTNEITNLKNDEKAIFTVISCDNGEIGKRFDGVVNITYAVENKLSHMMSGTLRTKVAEGSTISSSSICQNAQDNSLCNGLDLVFGLGYKEACCAEYTLCCP